MHVVGSEVSARSQTRHLAPGETGWTTIVSTPVFHVPLAAGVCTTRKNIWLRASHQPGGVSAFRENMVGSMNSPLPMRAPGCELD